MIDVRPLADEEWDRACELLNEAFHFPPALLDRLRVNPGGEFWAADMDGRVDAVLRVERCGQFFGGEPVPCATVGGVAVASEGRGKGLADVLLRGVLDCLRADGVMLSSLIPSVMGPYRRVGYEVAGTRVGRSLDLPAVRTAPGGPLERWDDGEVEEIKAVYRQYARSQAGLLDRPDTWWTYRTLAARDGERLNRFLYRRNGQVRGYLIYAEGPPAAAGPTGHPVDPFRYSITCRELVWLDADAGRALLSFFGGHRMLADRVRWSGPVEEPLTHLFSEAALVTDWTVPWMTRVVDVEGALAARGWSPAVSGRAAVSVVDPCLQRAQAVELALADGEAAVTPVAGAKAELGVGAFAALFTGWLRSSEAARLGLLTGASEQDLSFLDAAFAGPVPWLGEQI